MASTGFPHQPATQIEKILSPNKHLSKKLQSTADSILCQLKPASNLTSKNSVFSQQIFTPEAKFLLQRRRDKR